MRITIWSRWPTVLACILSAFICAPAQHSSASLNPQGLLARNAPDPPAPAATHPGTHLTVARSQSGDYVIGPEDLLSINVWREPEISRTVPVRPDGKISLPLIGDLTASGLTPLELRGVITQMLKAYVSAPAVTVIVQEIKSRTFNIVGEVLRPGSYPLVKPVTVLDAIALAGGFKEFARFSKVQVLRKLPNGAEKTLPFDYKSLIRGRKANENIQLQPGDTVVVP